MKLTGSMTLLPVHTVAYSFSNVINIPYYDDVMGNIICYFFHRKTLYIFIIKAPYCILVYMSCCELVAKAQLKHVAFHYQYPKKSPVCHRHQ